MKVINWRGIKIAITKVSLKNTSWLFNELGEGMQVASVKCWEQLAFATIVSLKSFERGTNKARTIKGEILLRLAGTIQIHEAIRQIGAKEGENFIVSFGKDADKRLRNFLIRHDLKEIPMKDCEKEKVKDLMELSAIVDVI